MILIVVLLAVIALAVLLLRRYPIRFGPIVWLPQRAFTYTLILASLLAVLFAASTLLGLLAGRVTNQLGALMSAEDVRNSASISLATLFIGLPICIGLWVREQRRAATSADGQNALERRLFLGAVFAATAIISLFSLQTLLQAMLTLPAPSSEHVSVLAGFTAFTRLLLFGPTWFFFVRVGWRERPAQAADWTHDLALYVTACFALGAFGVGLYEALREISIDLVGRTEYALSTSAFSSGPLRSEWADWGESLSWLIAGGAGWIAFLYYDLARGGTRLLRVLYLYAVSAYAAVAVVGVGMSTMVEILRRVFGFHPFEGEWVFLPDLLPMGITGAIVVAVHWIILRRQAILAGAPTSVEGGIPWPRRPARFALILVGLAMTTVGVSMMIWVGLDAVCGSATTQTSPEWWRDTLSGGIAAGLVGAVVWLPSWLLAQRAAVAAPTQERPALERRLLLWGVVTLSTLSTLGFTIALVWLLLRTVLGGPQDATTLANALQYLSCALISVAIVAYHGLILRQDHAYGPVRIRRMRVLAYAAPGTEAMIEELRRRSGLHIEIAGHLMTDGSGVVASMNTLEQRLTALEADDRAAGALLILERGGGTLYPYAKSAAHPPCDPGETTTPFEPERSCAAPHPETALPCGSFPAR